MKKLKIYKVLILDLRDNMKNHNKNIENYARNWNVQEEETKNVPRSLKI